MPTRCTHTQLKTTEEMAVKLQSEKGTLVRLRGLNVGTLFTRKPQQIRKQLLENPPLQTQNCSCAELKLLFNIPCGEQQNHIVLRNTEQWAAFHADHKVFTQNARNTTLPSRAQLDMCMHTFATSVAPILHTNDPDLPSHEHESHPAFTSIQQTTFDKSLAYVQDHETEHPHSGSDTLHQANIKLRSWGLVATQWDKKLHRLGAFCSMLLESHPQHGILLAEEFDLIGVSDSSWQCQAFALSLILKSASAHGVLSLGHEVGFLHKALLNPQYRTLFVAKHCIPTELWDVVPFPELLGLEPPKRVCAAPSIFGLPKWKLEELINCFLWRNVISFAHHPLKPLARAVGRCLTLMIKSVTALFPYMSLPSLMGVRDMFMAMHVLNKDVGPVVVRERDMDNCYWEIPKDAAIMALKSVKDHILQLDVNRTELWFSIASANDRHTDRIGKSADSDFTVLSFEQIHKYVVWELYHNTYFCVDQILMRQGERGVPIGGFLSAQLMVLYAIAQEIKIMNPTGMQKHMKKVSRKYCKEKLPAFQFSAGPELTFQRPPLAPRISTFFESYGMKGWFDPQNKTIGFVDIAGTTCELQMLQLWDAHPHGRFGHIIQSAPKRARPLLNTHFALLNHKKVM